MLCNQPPEGWITKGVTLTIPGPVITGKEAKELWNHYCKNFVVRKGWCSVWRVEVQKRKQSHFHCIMSGPPPSGMLSSGKDIYDVFHNVAIREAWLSALDKLGGCSGKVPLRDGATGFYESLDRDGVRVMSAKLDPSCTDAIDVTVTSRRCWPGAEQYAVDVQEDGDNSAWFRYLQDHASKMKQEQISGFGRQWGVVGRKHFRKAHSLTANLTGEDVHQVLRVMRRLFLKVIPDSRDPRGFRFGKKFSRGARGKSVWFSEASKQKALMRFVASLQSPSDSSTDGH